MVWLLTTLKIIGIILLIIVGIVLVLACLVLFVPIKYRYKYRYIDDDMEKNCHFFDVSWLWQIVKCRIEISLSGLKYKTRLFGIRTKWLDRIISNEGKQDAYDGEFAYDDLDLDSDEDEVKDTLDEVTYVWEDVAKAEDELKAMLGEDAELLHTIIDEETLENEFDEDYEDNLYVMRRKNNRVKVAFQRFIAWVKSMLRVLNPKVWLKIIIDKLVALGKFIDKLINSVVETIKIIIKRINIISEFLDKKSTIDGLEKAKKYIDKTCKFILPRKKKIVLHIGFDDPSYTGKALGILGLIYAKCGKTMEVFPNFSQKELKASVLFKGRVRGISILIIGLKIIRDKAIKRLLRNIKMVKEEW